MKHYFEEWYEKLHYKREITDSIKELFEESVKCHKAGAYRSAIIMGFNGFSLIIRNRLIENKEELKKETLHHKGKNIVDIPTTKLLDDTKWDTSLYGYVVDNFNRFNIIFPNKSEWHQGWVYWRNRRNIGAHAKLVKLYHYDVESLYNWIIHAENILYPFVSCKKWTGKFQEYISNRLAPNTESINIISDLCKLDKNQWSDFLEELTNSIINDDDFSNSNNKIISIIDSLYKEKPTDMISFLEEIIDSPRYTECTKSNLFSQLCRHNSFYLQLDKDKQYCFIKYITDLEMLLRFIDHGINIEYIRPSIEKSNLSIISDELYTHNIVLAEHTRRCANLRQSTSFGNTRDILENISVKHLQKIDVQLILEAMAENNLVSSYGHIATYLNKGYPIWKDKYPDLDYPNW